MKHTHTHTAHNPIQLSKGQLGNKDEEAKIPEIREAQRN